MVWWSAVVAWLGVLQVGYGCDNLDLTTWPGAALVRSHNMQVRCAVP